MPRYNKPEYITEWEKDPGTPHCCWRCAYFDKQACTCSKHDNALVPEEFAANRDPKTRCQEWLDMDGGYPF